MNRHYSAEERNAALAELDRTQSPTKNIRNLGHPSRWTLFN